MDLGAGDHSPFSRILGNKDTKQTANFSFSDWQALLPNLGSGYPSNGVHRPQQPQPRRKLFNLKILKNETFFLIGTKFCSLISYYLYQTNMLFFSVADRLDSNGSRHYGC